MLSVGARLKMSPRHKPVTTVISPLVHDQIPGRGRRQLGTAARAASKLPRGSTRNGRVSCCWSPRMRPSAQRDEFKRIIECHGEFTKGLNSCRRARSGKGDGGGAS